MSFSASKETTVAVGQVEFPKMDSTGRPIPQENLCPQLLSLNLGATL